MFKLSLACLWAFVGLSTSAFAISEKDYAAGVYEREVQPFFDAGETGTFRGARGVPINYRVFDRGRGWGQGMMLDAGAFVILPGRGEPLLKYAELVYDLAKLYPDHSFYLIDHRGQGQSGRMTKISDIGHVDEFRDYMRDFRYFMNNVVNVVPHPRTILIGHSMGGAIATLYAMVHPDEVSKLVLSAPMHEINTSPYHEAVAYGIVSGLCAIGKGKEFTIGQSGYDPDETLEHYHATHSPARFAMMREIGNTHPETRIGGPSNQWVREGLEATTWLNFKASRLKARTVLFQAGEDTVVRPGGQNHICERSSSCKKVRFEHSWHEILMEQDAIRDVVLREIQELLAH